MGRSAKLHKRVKKTASSLAQAPKAPTTSKHSNGPSNSAAASAAKKRGLKAKASSTKRTPGQEGHVLGGADYVDLMMGSRRKAKEEAKKLPVD